MHRSIDNEREDDEYTMECDEEVVGITERKIEMNDRFPFETLQLVST